MIGGVIMVLNKIKTKNKTSILIFSLMLIFILFVLMSVHSVYAAYKGNPSDIRDDLWETGGMSSQTTGDILTANALMHYGKNGVFGSACRVNLQGLPTNADLDDITSACSEIGKFHEAASTYADIVDSRMKIADPEGKRLDESLTNFNELSQVVFSYMIVFGELTAILVFIILFMQLAWMPSHAFQKRKLFVDIATSGTSIILLGNIWLVVSLFQSSFNRFWQSFAVYSKDWRRVAAMVLVEYKGFIVGLSGIATLLVLGMFVVNFIGLATNAGQANKRSEKISALLNCGIAAAGLGSVTLIVGVFWNLFA
jgi:hypothetical protein